MDYEHMSEKELEIRERIMELENKDKKLDQQRTMAMMILISSIAAVFLLISPIVPLEKVDAVEPVIQTFLGANAVVVSAFLGAAAYQTTRKSS